MEHPRQPPDDALQQRFRDLTEQLHHIYQSWQEVYDQQDVTRQMDLIDRERAIVAQLQEIIAAFRQALQARQASYRRPRSGRDDPP
jgi:hypothetical protein